MTSPYDQKPKLTYVRFTYLGSVVGFGWIIPSLWPSRMSAVAWEEMPAPQINTPPAEPQQYDPPGIDDAGKPCTCPCHSQGGIIHFTPCCYPKVEKWGAYGILDTPKIT
jgi:hypothetical protein